MWAAVPRATKLAPAASASRQRSKGGSTLAVTGGGGPVAHAHGGRGLAAGHAVDLVVEEDAGEVDVAPAGVDEVVAADGGAVAVAGEHHHGEVRAGHLDAGGDRQRPPVDGVHRAQVDVVGGAAGAADAAHHHGLLALEAQIEHDPQEGRR